MAKYRNHINREYGDEAPTLKEFLAVLLVVAVLIAFAWIAYYKFHWFH